MKFIIKLTPFFGLLFGTSCCNSQLASPYAPETGVYSGSTLNVTGTMNYVYNPITGFGFSPGTSTTPGLNLLGNLTITASGNSGTYSFSKMKDWKGKWNYDAEKDKLSFTGQLKDAFQYYHAGKGYYQITLLVKTNVSDKGGVTYYFSKKASREFPKRMHPNGNINGLFTVKPDANTISFFNAATGKIEKNFAGKIAATNPAQSTIAIGFTDNTHLYEIKITDVAGKIKQMTSAAIASFNWKFLDYKYGVLSNDGTKMALLGKTPDSYLNLTYTPGEFSVGIFDLNGTLHGIFPLEPNRFIIPSFLPDGRLVYCPRNGGIAITDAAYKNSKSIYQNPINALAVSPDGKMIVYSEGIYFYTVSIDGSNKTQIRCDGENLEANSAENVITMACSPDGHYFAVSYKGGSKYGILVVPFDGGGYFWVKDEYGEIYEHTGENISWH